MMTTNELRESIISSLGIQDATPEEQASALSKIESIAIQRFASELPNLLSDAQVDEVDKMRAAHKTDDEVMDYIVQQVPQYNELMEAMILDVTQEIAEV